MWDLGSQSASADLYLSPAPDAALLFVDARVGVRQADLERHMRGIQPPTVRAIVMNREGDTANTQALEFARELALTQKMLFFEVDLVREGTRRVLSILNQIISSMPPKYKKPGRPERLDSIQSYAPAPEPEPAAGCASRCAVM